MKKTAKISVVSHNKVDDETMSLFVEGIVQCDLLGRTIEYTQVDEHDQTCETCVFVSNHIVTVTKKATETYTMVFEEGKVTETMIETPIGNLPAKIITSIVEISETDTSIQINLKYCIELCGNSCVLDHAMLISCNYLS